MSEPKVIPTNAYLALFFDDAVRGEMPADVREELAYRDLAPERETPVPEMAENNVIQAAFAEGLTTEEIGALLRLREARHLTIGLSSTGAQTWRWHIYLPLPDGKGDRRVWLDEWAAERRMLAAVSGVTGTAQAS